MEMVDTRLLTVEVTVSTLDSPILILLILISTPLDPAWVGNMPLSLDSMLENSCIELTSNDYSLN